MPTSSRARWSTVLLLLGWAVPLSAQDALSRVGPETAVRSVQFQVVGKQALDEDVLPGKIALTGQGSFVGLRRTFGFLPFVPPVGSHPFDPVEMQRDVIRLRNFYQRSGFPNADVEYRVRYRAKPDQVDVTYRIAEGPPLQIDTVQFAGLGEPLEIPRELDRTWRQFARRAQGQADRYGEDEQQALADSTVRWFRAHGYPFAGAKVTALVDSTANLASVTVQVQPGSRARIRKIAVTGNQTIPTREIVRQLPIGLHRWYDARALEEGRQKLTQMDIMRLTSVEVPRDSADDSSVVVLLHVTQNPEHVVKGQAGFISAGGLTSQLEWSDRSWLRGLRTFTVAATAQSGVAALENPAQRLYRFNITAFEPYVGDRRISAAGGPFIEYRNDLRDRSWATGFEGSLIWAPQPLRSVSLGYSISHRRIYDYGFGNNLAPAQYLPLLGLADSSAAGTLETNTNRSTFSLEGSYGRLDRIANPRKGYVIRPRVEVTTPWLNTSEFVLVDLGATAFVPLSKRVGFTFKAGGGRIYPFGNSTTFLGNESPFVSLLRLRDVTFTAGGTRDVRGWGTLLVGPKIPQVELQSSGDTTVSVANRYSPVGGLARLLGSVELHFPMPLMGDAFPPYLFYDAGKIWTPDSRFALNAGELDEDKVYQSVGIGIGYETVVGAIQVAVGYKLNPSPLDLRSPQDVLDALRSGTSIDAAPTSTSRRFHLHFSIGSSF
jgi:outer membrane protein insertion porin family